MQDFSTLLGNQKGAICQGLQSAMLSGHSSSPAQAQGYEAEMQAGIERRAGKRAVADMKFAQAMGLSTEQLAANRTTAIAAPIATPGQSQGRGTGMQI